MRNYTGRRRAWEEALAALMRSDWPSNASERLWQPPVLLTERELHVGKPLGEADRLRVGFLADLHAGPMTSQRTIDSACELLTNAAPDVILLGGDFVSFKSEYAKRLVAPLRALSASAGVFAVLGNHDHWAGAADVQHILADAGVQWLDNTSRRLPAPWENTIVAGIDDHMSGTPDASRIAWDASATTLLLMHQPSGLLDVPGRPFDLAMAGHTHAGQIVLPFGVALVAPYGALSRTYLGGRYSIEPARELYVTRGVGNNGVPFRIGSPSEVVVYTVTGVSARSKGQSI